MKKLNDDIAFWHWARARQAKSGVSWSSYWEQLGLSGKIDFRATGIDSNGLTLVSPVGSGATLKQLPCLTINRSTSDRLMASGSGLLMTGANTIYQFYLETIIESHESNTRGDIFSSNALLGPNGWSFRSYGPGFYLQIEDATGSYACNQIVGNYFVIGLNTITLTFNIPTKVVTVLINGKSYEFTHDRANVFDAAPRALCVGQGANSKMHKPIYLKISENEAIVHEYIFGQAFKASGSALYTVRDMVGTIDFVQQNGSPSLSTQDLLNPFKNGYDLYWHEDTMRYRDFTPKNNAGVSRNPIPALQPGIIPILHSVAASDLGYHMINYIEMPNIPIFDTTSRTYWKMSIEDDPYYVGGTAGRERWFHKSWLDFDWINDHIEDDYRGLIFVQCRWAKAVGDQYVKTKIEDIVLLNEAQARLASRQDFYESVDMGRFYESSFAKSSSRVIYNTLATLGDKRVVLYGNYLYYSEDAGISYSAGIDFSAIYAVANIDNVRIMSNGNIVIFSNNKLIHYSDDNLATITAATVLDVNGDPYVFADDSGQYWKGLNPFIEHDGIAVYGNYPVTGNSQYSHPKLYYTKDFGVTWQIFYEFGGDGMLVTNHIHGVNIGYDGIFYVFTGDANLIFAKCVYDAVEDAWEVSSLLGDTAQTWQRLRAIGGYEKDGYIYWGVDATDPITVGGVAYQTRGIYKCAIADINDITKHVLLSAPSAALSCLSFINNPANGKVIASFTTEIHMSGDYGETWEVFTNLFDSNLIPCTANVDGDFWTAYRNIVLKYLV